MKNISKFLFVVSLCAFSLISYSTENKCVKELSEYGIEIIESDTDFDNPNYRVIEFIFNENYQTEGQKHSTAYVQFKQQPSFYMRTALFVGKHENTDPFNKSTYTVFIHKQMLPFFTADLVYMIDSKYQKDHLDVILSGFDNLDSLMCRHISYNQMVIKGSYMDPHQIKGLDHRSGLYASLVIKYGYCISNFMFGFFIMFCLHMQAE